MRERHGIPYEQTLQAEMKPDLYGGKDCDALIPQWETYGEGDKDSDSTAEPLQLEAKQFPPGTMVIVLEPACPNCGRTRTPLFRSMAGVDQIFASECECGDFNWDEWVEQHFS